MSKRKNTVLFSIFLYLCIYMSKMKKKGYEVNISEDRFLELSTNPQTGQYDEKSIFETEGGL